MKYSSRKIFQQRRRVIHDMVCDRPEITGSVTLSILYTNAAARYYNKSMGETLTGEGYAGATALHFPGISLVLSAEGQLIIRRGGG
jgi:hypothetical protein